MAAGSLQPVHSPRFMPSLATEGPPSRIAVQVKRSARRMGFNLVSTSATSSSYAAKAYSASSPGRVGYAVGTHSSPSTGGPTVSQSIAAVALVVADYDEA